MSLKSSLRKLDIHECRYVAFCVLWIIYYLTIFLDNTAWYVLNQTESMLSIIKTIRYFVYLSLMALIISREHKCVKLVVRAFVCAIILGIQSIAINSNILIALLLWAFESSEFDSAKIIECSAKTEAFFLFATIASAYSIPGLSVLVYEADRNVIRNLFGFSWAFHAPNLLLFVYLQFIYIKKSNIKLTHILIFWTLSIFFSYITKTRTPLILTIGASLIVMLVKHSRRFGRIINKQQFFFKSLPFIAFAISLYFTLAYDNTTVLNEINTILHNRLLLANNAYEKYGITFWGQEISWVGSQFLTETTFEYNFVDNAYMQILIKNGIFVTAFTLIIYYIMLKKSLKTQDYYLTITLAVVIIYGMINPCLLDLTMNPFLLLIFSKFSSMKGVDKKAILNKFIKNF